MAIDRPSEPRPSWARARALRFRNGARNAAARPWYAERLERREQSADATLPLGPYETRYDITTGYAFERPRDHR